MKLIIDIPEDLYGQLIKSDNPSYLEYCVRNGTQLKTGNWEIDASDQNYFKGGLSVFRCSNCNDTSIYKSNYCPNCGAYIGGEE